MLCFALLLLLLCYAMLCYDNRSKGTFVFYCFAFFPSSLSLPVSPVHHVQLGNRRGFFYLFLRGKKKRHHTIHNNQYRFAEGAKVTRPSLKPQYLSSSLSFSLSLLCLSLSLFLLYVPVVSVTKYLGFSTIITKLLSPPYFVKVSYRMWSATNQPAAT